MASIAERKNKNTGEVISYQIKVSRGRDPITKKQLTPYTMTWTPPEGWSKRAIDRELQKVACEFEMKCKNGEIKTKEERREQILEEMKTPTFRAYIDSYITEITPFLEPGTIALYKIQLNHAVATLGDMKMTDITLQDLKRYFSEFQCRGYTIGYVTLHHKTLKAFFKSAVENEIIPFNPMEGMKQPKPRQDEEIKEIGAFTRDEVAEILDCAKNEPLKWQCYIYLSLDSGCRRGELVALKWEDIDFTTGECNISKNAKYTKETGDIIGKTKNKKSRVIYIDPESPVLKMLKQWQNEQRKYFFANGLKNEGFIFTNDVTGKRISVNTPTTHLKKFGRKYNIKDLHPHKFRHTLPTFAITGGADIASVSKQLGHSRISTTLDIYTTATNEAQKEAKKIYSDIIYNKKEA